MKHTLPHFTATDLQRRISSPYINRTDKLAAISELHKRLTEHYTNTPITVTQYLAQSNCN